MGNLGYLLKKLERNDDAEPISRAVLARHRSKFGDQDRRTLRAAENLSALLEIMGKHAKAASLASEASAGTTRTLGGAHTSTRASSRRLFMAQLQPESDYAAVERLLERVPSDDLAGCRYEGVGWCKSRQEYDRARSLFEKVVASWREAPPPPDDLGVIDAVEGLTDVLMAPYRMTQRVTQRMMADYRSAVPLLVESLASRCKQHGDAHEDVIASRLNLAEAHLLLQNCTAAFPLIFAAVSAQQQAGFCPGLDDATLQGYVQQVHTLFKAGHAPYRVGQPVSVHGLTSEAGQRLNGCTARVKYVVPATGRYVVRLDAGDFKAFKPGNLRQA